MSINSILFSLGLALLCSGVVHAADEKADPEKWRPQFHFTSETDWINDPNGLVFYDGEYHLFFQRTPGTVHGDANKMVWGHAVSTDLMHWQQLTNAIPMGDDGAIWSGSAVVDWKNTTGFGKDGEPPLVAMYTMAKAPFAQGIAYSTDRGRTWTKFAGNPVVAHINGQNRDPKVIWYEPTHQWVMALYLDRPSSFALFTSPDMKKWTQLQTVTLDYDNECPDFFPLNLDGDASKPMWVFTAASGHYVVGSFDGKTFIPMTDSIESERGPNRYAAQTYSDIPASDGRRIQIGWMRRDGEYPDAVFNQQQSIPCTLTLKSTPRGPRLFRWPVKEIDVLRTDRQTRENAAFSPGKPLNPINVSDLTNIDATLDPGKATDVNMNIRGLPITLHRDGDVWSLTAWDRHVALPQGDGKLRLRVIADRTSIEIFADNGSTTLSGCYFAPDDKKSIDLTAVGGEVIVDWLTSDRLKSAR